MQNVLVIGAGTGGSILLNLLQKLDVMNVTAIIDKNPQAPGILRAQQLGIQTALDWRPFIHEELHMIFDVTGDEQVFRELLQKRSSQTVVIPGSVANLLVKLLEENEAYTKQIQTEMHRQRMILDSIEEGMIGIDDTGHINFFNRSAARMTGVQIDEAIGRHINDVIPSSELLRVFTSGQSELNQELTLANGFEIVTSRHPLIDHHGNRVGAFAVFKDISEVVALAEEITDLNEVKNMLEAIIHSSDDAISVVDNEGKGILVNPAYTRLTGLSEDEIIGKPATVDINEGESIHLKVLKNGNPMRGVHLRVGENNREVIVNAAPIIVDQEVKGSVGVIHDITEMRNLMRELDKAKTIIRKLESTYTFDDIFGQSEDIAIAIAQAKVASTSNLPVLLRGESGTGKELFAHAIHSGGDRRNKKFIRVNCAAVQPDEMEIKLFGSELKTFSFEPGDSLFEEADEGTLFLNEVGELPLHVQERLLTYVKEGKIQHKKRTVSPDVRIITASSINLEKRMLEGAFLEELYYALHRLTIQITPLRHRPVDISVTAMHMLSKLNLEFGMKVKQISDAALTFLLQHDWPGNVRELENVLSRAMIYMNPSEAILDVEDVQKSLSSKDQKSEELPLPDKSTLTSLMDDYEKTVLETVLREHDGNKSLTANRLGISLRSLYYKLEKYHLV